MSILKGKTWGKKILIVVGLIIIDGLITWGWVAYKRSDNIKRERTEELSLPKAECTNIEITESNELKIYYPQYGKIDLVCETMPSPNDNSVLMCCEAAFTGELLDDFKHSNIAGNHVSNGVFHKGYKCKANTGCFAYYADSGKWEFAMGEYAECLDKAVRHGGAAFGQTMIIHNGADVHNGRPCKDTSKNQYRALCELNGKLCIIDAKATMPYKDFILSLLDIGVKHAIYLDMGSGWNYSYYRGNEGKVHYIHNRQIKYTTNWITFYK
ncbi:MAG: hypothetical protein KHX42_04370 [Prevotella sp.]|nr:hypothetical protein [Prevotella sp.]